jgi:hypothetical protein
MAQSVKSDTNEPVNPTVEFKPNSMVHAVVAIQNAPANTTVKTAWYATDVGKAAPCNTLIGEAELTEVVGSSNLDFQQGPIVPVGAYRVQVYVNGTMDRVVNFSVK